MVEAHDDEREGHRRALNLLKAHPDLAGIYVSTVNSLPVLRAVEEAGRLPGLTIVTTDLFPELVKWIRAGKVMATVYQRPLSQGRLALQALYQFLADGTCPPPRIKVVPHVVMRSNLDLFLERLPVDLEGGIDEPAPLCPPAARPALLHRPLLNPDRPLGLQDHLEPRPVVVTGGKVTGCSSPSRRRSNRSSSPASSRRRPCRARATKPAPSPARGRCRRTSRPRPRRPSRASRTRTPPIRSVPRRGHQSKYIAGSSDGRLVAVVDRARAAACRRRGHRAGRAAVGHGVGRADRVGRRQPDDHLARGRGSPTSRTESP